MAHSSPAPQGEVQAFHDLVMRRPVRPLHCARAAARTHVTPTGNAQQGLGLLTASNHASTFDDPPLMVSIVPGSILLHPHLVRWALCAEDVCFKRKSALDKCLSTFFDTGKVLPVRRGGGIRQDMLMAPVNKLREGCAARRRARSLDATHASQMSPQRLGTHLPRGQSVSRQCGRVSPRGCVCTATHPQRRRARRARPDTHASRRAQWGG